MTSLCFSHGAVALAAGVRPSISSFSSARKARGRVSVRLSSEEAMEGAQVEVEVGGGDGGGADGNFGNGSGGDGSGDGEGPSRSDREMVMRFMESSGATVEQVDPKVWSAFQTGNISGLAVVNYLKCILNPAKKLFLRLLPFTLSRVLADNLFIFKVGVEEGLGIFGKLSAEAEQRRGSFFKEIDFVLCNLLTAFLVDFGLVYLPAPSVKLRGEGAESWIKMMNRVLPSSIFVKDPAVTMAQRFQGYFWTGAKLFGVGFACCFTSAVLTNLIIFSRAKLDPSFTPENSMQNPFSVSAMYATFLALSSNTRYQIVNGIEQHFLPVLFGRLPPIATEAATLGLRFGNTFWGSQQWVIFATLTGVQKSGH
ncbi:hypothetical protein NDN08_004079 [Rhodosorus marinus]|uniref:Uncharacterized protein n=1 Tax=Rhodosorus marinus TaxID=101924 RepID=A0AAV8UH85_9RHOD|nr:hypothetical protein NDN08_004079 [Rhodosorus marinus]